MIQKKSHSKNKNIPKDPINSLRLNAFKMKKIKMRNIFVIFNWFKMRLTVKEMDLEENKINKLYFKDIFWITKDMEQES